MISAKSAPSTRVAHDAGDPVAACLYVAFVLSNNSCLMHRSSSTRLARVRKKKAVAKLVQLVYIANRKVTNPLLK